MAKGRKTIDVEAIKAILNGHLERNDDTATDDFKKGVTTALEKILLMTGNYDGYRYIMDDGYGNEYDRQYN